MPVNREKSIFLSGEFDSNGLSADHTVNAAELALIQPETAYRVELLNARITKPFHTINSYNDTFYFTKDNLTTVLPIVLAHGKCETAADLAKVVEEALQKSNATTYPYFNVTNIVSVTANGTLSFDFDGSPMPQGSYFFTFSRDEKTYAGGDNHLLLGGRRSETSSNIVPMFVTETGTAATGAVSHQGIHVPLLNRKQLFYLRSNLTSDHLSNEIKSNEVHPSPIMAVVDVDMTHADNLVYDAALDNQYTTLHTSTGGLRRIQFSITDAHNNPIQNYCKFPSATPIYCHTSWRWESLVGEPVTSGHSFKSMPVLRQPLM